MDSVRVDICYRPIRVGWLIDAGNREQFQKAVLWSNALWGGRFNPIVEVDEDDQQIDALLSAFRVDLLWPLGKSARIDAVLDRYDHLKKVLFSDKLFHNEGHRKYSILLDVFNSMSKASESRGWKEEIVGHSKIFSWDDSDRLRDVFAMQLGRYPLPEESGIDYRAAFKQYAQAEETHIDLDGKVPSLLDVFSISAMSRYGVDEHHAVDVSRNRNAGLFLGDAGSLSDLVEFWNIRACSVPLLFVDIEDYERFSDVLAGYVQQFDSESGSDGRNVEVWSRRGAAEIAPILADKPYTLRKLRLPTGTEISDYVPMMVFGETAALGVMSESNGGSQVTFSLNDRPFSSDWRFSFTHLVASVQIYSGTNESQRTMTVPYLPRLNPFYGKEMSYDWSKVRIEPDRIGLIISAMDTELSVSSVQVQELFTKIFEYGGYEARISSAGLITQQLIKRLGGVQGARVFKIAGVRRLLKSHSLTDSIRKHVALRSIGSRDSDGSNSFERHKRLFIEPRSIRSDLTASNVFEFLVAKGLFRIGVDATCPACRISSWISLDTLKHSTECSLCGEQFDVTRQLVEADSWSYRKSGVFGAERNAQGAVPVALTLQQLDSNFMSIGGRSLYLPSVELSNSCGKVEIDFVWASMQRVGGRHPTTLILGECKDVGPATAEEMQSLKSVADSFREPEFKTFVLFSQLAPFSEAQVAAAKALYPTGSRRVILLSAEELQGHFFYADETKPGGGQRFASGPEDLAAITEADYFS